MYGQELNDCIQVLEALAITDTAYDRNTMIVIVSALIPKLKAIQAASQQQQRFEQVVLAGHD